MTFDVRTIIAESKFEPFEFIGQDGRTVRLPHIRELTPRQAIALDNRDLEVLEEFAPELLDLPGAAFEAVLERWLEHCGIDPGKFQQSRRSSRKRGRR